MEVGAERAGHLLGEERPERLARDAPHHLAHQEALRARVVARRRARLPPRRLGGEQGGALVPVLQVGGHQRLVPARQARRVAEQVAHQHALLAVGGELGPVARHRRVQVELAAVGQHQRDQERHGLGGRPHVGDGVALPGSGAGLVGPAAPDVDDQAAVLHDGHRTAHVRAGVDAGRERLGHAGEAVIEAAVDLGHGSPSVRPTPGHPEAKLHGTAAPAWPPRRVSAPARPPGRAPPARRCGPPSHRRWDGSTRHRSRRTPAGDPGPAPPPRRR